VRVRVTFDFSDREREAIRKFHGETGSASRSEVETFVRMIVNAEIDKVIEGLNPPTDAAGGTCDQ
jgi:hypothetical protein